MDRRGRNSGSLFPSDVVLHPAIFNFQFSIFNLQCPSRSHGERRPECGKGPKRWIRFLYFLARAVIAFLQSLPWPGCAAGPGRGALAYGLEWRHRRVAQANLARCLGAEKSVAEIRALARENFRRIGEGFACAVRPLR